MHSSGASFPGLKSIFFETVSMRTDKYESKSQECDHVNQY